MDDGNLGRFISEDPIGMAGGINSFNYVGSNPVSNTDGAGLLGEDFLERLKENANRYVQRAIEALETPIIFSYGVGDTASLGITRKIRQWEGLDDPNLDCSLAYQAGEWTAIGIQLIEGGVGLYKFGAKIAGKIAARRALRTAELGGELIEDAGKLCARCFEAETEVQTDEGLKPIEKIEAGDKVLSYNEETHLLEYRQVLAKFTRYADDIYSVQVEGESKPLGVTSEHPFFVRVYRARDSLISGDDDGEWRETQNLQIGDEIKLANGTWAKVLEVKFKGKGQVYNFTVAGNHNYFVGDLRLLTHNICNLNSNAAKGNFGVYEIEIDGNIHKYGKADLDRITDSTGLPTRLHQQVRKLQELNPNSNVTGQVIHQLPNSTTKQIKAIESSIIQSHYDSTGIVPIGNSKSFRPR